MKRLPLLRAVLLASTCVRLPPFTKASYHRALMLSATALWPFLAPIVDKAVARHAR